MWKLESNPNKSKYLFDSCYLYCERSCTEWSKQNHNMRNCIIERATSAKKIGFRYCHHYCFCRVWIRFECKMQVKFKFQGLVQLHSRYKIVVLSRKKILLSSLFRWFFFNLLKIEFHVILASSVIRSFCKWNIF